MAAEILSVTVADQFENTGPSLLVGGEAPSAFILSVAVADQFEFIADEISALVDGEPPSAFILSVTVADQFDNPAIIIPFAGMSKECAHTCPLGQFAQVTYDGGTDAGGPFIRASEAASEVAFYGLLALYDPAQEAIALMHYDGESLDGPGTVIAAVSQTLVAGDVLRIEADDSNEDLYRVKVNGVAVISAVLTDDELEVTNPCIGFAVVGEPGVIEVPGGGEEDAMIAIQLTDQSKTNDTLADSDLTLAMEANSDYVGSLAVEFESASSTPDLKIKLVAPALAEGLRFDNSFNYQADAINTEVGYSLSAGSRLAFHWDFTVRNGANAGNLTLQFAQGVTNATATVLHKDSHMLMFKKV